jgi:hypothetical protein
VQFYVHRAFEQISAVNAHTSLPGTREFRSHLQISSVSCDASAPVVALISKTALLFRPDSSSLPLSAAVDPLMTHVPATSLHEALLIRFPGGGGLDNTTAMLCCQVKSPISVQSFDAECDRVHVQWYRLITPSQRTPAIKIELTSLRCEHTPQLSTSSQSSSSPSISSSSSSSSCTASSSAPIFQSASVPFKIFALCDGTMQVQNYIYSHKTSFLRCYRSRFLIVRFRKTRSNSLRAGVQQRLPGLGLCRGALCCQSDHRIKRRCLTRMQFSIAQPSDRD